MSNILSSNLAPAANTASTAAAKSTTEKKSSGDNREAAKITDITKVSLSGKALMLSRLFNTNNINANIPVETNVNDSSVVLKANRFTFLNQADRSIIEKAYEIAAAKGIDLQQVNALASDMSEFRESGHWPKSDAVNLEGRIVKFSFNANDAEIADRLKKSDTSMFDQGFMNRLLNEPQYSRGVDFRFLELLSQEISLPGSTEKLDISPLKSPPKPVEVVQFVTEKFSPGFLAEKKLSQDLKEASSASPSSTLATPQDIRKSILTSLLESQNERDMISKKKMLDRIYGDYK